MTEAGRRRDRRRERRPRIAAWDLIGEGLAWITRRRMRSALTALGTVLGVGTFVATLGLTSTAGAQISNRFDLLKATEVVVQDSRPDEADPPFTADAETRLRRLNGVREAGVYWTVKTEGLMVRRTARRQPGGGGEEGAAVMAASPGALRAAEVRLSSGALFDPLLSRRAEPVALLGVGAARRLGLTSVADRPAIFLGDRPFTVVGIIADTKRNPDLLLSVVIPEGTAERFWNNRDAQRSILINTELGAAQLIGGQAARQLRPHDPERLQVTVPPDPRTLRQGVESDVRTLFLLLAGVSLTIGTVGIANTTLVSVMERTAEIGLRRALGARRRHIAAQFLTESCLLGSIGGLIGTCMAVVVVVVVSAAREWHPVMDLEILAMAPLLGIFTGLIAGAYPAVKASGIPPVQALSR